MSNKRSYYNTGRIQILDGFRAIAILGVMFQHYFYRWNDPVQPYSGAEFFHYGFKGVSFFFMISGFVICYSLEGTENYIAFWKKRFIRLFPSMLIASILTFVFLSIFDTTKIFEDSNHLRNLITSISFLPPNVYDWIFGTRCYFSYINYSYWSLWPEIQFYFLASTIYFIDKTNFKKNFIIICSSLLILYYGLLFLGFNQIRFVEKLFNLFNMIKYLSFFLSGALFYMLYKNKTHFVYLHVLLFVFIIMNLSLRLSDLLTSTITYLLFLFLIYSPQVLLIFENKFLVTIGFSSYFLYLIHEYIGVVWIRNIVVFFYPNSFIAPLLIMTFMIFFSIIYTKKIESKIIKSLNKNLFKRKND